MAGDDFTGPPVLKLHFSTGFSGNRASLVPASDGCPRNIGQSDAAWTATTAHKADSSAATRRRSEDGFITAVNISHAPDVGKGFTTGA